MISSDAINELAAALAIAQGDIEGAKKDSANPFFKSTYADLASVWDACRGPLSKNGLAVVQFPKTDYLSEPEQYEWTAKSGEKHLAVRVVTKVSVLTRLVHSSGQFMEDAYSTILPTGDPQAIGSAVTYLRRYALQSVAGIAPEDDDGNAGSQPEGRQESQTKLESSSYVCPKCGKAGAIMQSDGKYTTAGTWFCWKNRGGCGAKELPADTFEVDPAKQAERAAAGAQDSITLLRGYLQKACKCATTEDANAVVYFATHHEYTSVESAKATPEDAVKVLEAIKKHDPATILQAAHDDIDAETAFSKSAS